MTHHILLNMYTTKGYISVMRIRVFHNNEFFTVLPIFTDETCVN